MQASTLISIPTHIMDHWSCTDLWEHRPGSDWSLLLKDGIWVREGASVARPLLSLGILGFAVASKGPSLPIGIQAHYRI